MESEDYSVTLSVDAADKIKERDYWLNRLAEVGHKSVFPYDLQHSRTGSERADTVMNTRPFTFTGELFSRLMKIVNRSDLRLFILLGAGVAALLEKYTGSGDIIIGALIDRQETSGTFLNTLLILRNQLDQDMTFKELLQQMSQTVAEASEHVNYPVETLLYQLKIPWSRQDDFPLFDVVVLLENIHDKSYIEHIRSNMVFSFNRTYDRVTGRLTYSSELYDSVTIDRIIRHLGLLLEDAVNRPNQRLRDVNILPLQEREQLLHQFNQTDTVLPLEGPIDRVFVRQAVAIPDCIAAVDVENMGFLSYGSLNTRARQLAGLLRSRGVKANSIVAIMVERSLEMMVAILAIIQAGGAYLPINPENPRSRIDYMLKDSGTGLLLAQKKYTRNPYGLEVLDLQDSSIYDGDPAAVRRSQGAHGTNHLVYVIYTSGSTGRPKGVMVEHHSLLNLVAGLKQRIYRYYGPGLKVALVATYVFDASVQQIFTALLLGHSLYIVPENTRVDGAALLDFFERYRIEISDGTPIHLNLMLESVDSRQNRSGVRPLETVKHLLIGGEALPLKLVERFFTQVGTHDLKITNLYGPAECCVDCVSFDISSCTVQALSFMPIGRPLPNQRIFIVDRRLNVQPIGVSGELGIGGPGVARGYIGKGELTGEKFIPHPFEPGQRLYRTGDLARFREDGTIEFLGRLDHQVKIRGLRIELGEIENLLLGHEDVQEAVVVARGNGSGGNGGQDQYLCGYVVLKPGREMADLGVRDYLSRELPNYMIPSHFVRLQRLPLNRSGKVDRRALPEPEVNGTMVAYVAPRNELERKLVRIWADVLKVDEQSIGIDSDFFALGGHSLKATVQISRIHKELGVKIPLAEVFTDPTVRGLYQYIREKGKEQFTRIGRVEEREYYLPSSPQNRIYIMQQMEKASIAYNVPLVMRLEGTIDRAKLAAALQELVRRHDSLRTSFEVIQGQLVQRVHGEVDFEIEYYNTAAKHAKAREIKNFIRPFDISRPPLLRVGMAGHPSQELTHPAPSGHPSQEGEHIMMVDMHHIISDGVSSDIFFRELVALYAGRILPVLPLQYKDFCRWRSSRSETRRIQRQADYWLSTLSGELPVLDLPTDYPRPSRPTFEGRTIPFELTEEYAAFLREYAAAREASLFMILLSIFNILLAKIYGKEDIVVGTAVAGRRHADLESVIGVFINTLVLRNRPAGGLTFKEFLQRVRDNTLEAFENQEYQFEDLVDRLNRERVPGRHPLFDVMIQLQNIGSGPIEVPGLRARPYDYDYRIAKFDLTLMVMEDGDSLRLAVEYRTPLFKQQTIDRLIRYFKNIIAQVKTEPLIRLENIQISHDLLPADSTPHLDQESDFGF